MRILFISFAILCFLACEQNDETDTIDLINVVRQGATIPAYIYGDTSSDIFLIILHGGPGGNGLEYKLGSFSDRLESNYAVVYTDQRGQGMSQSGLSGPENSLELMTEDVYALALSLRAKYGEDIKLFLMGHSWGGLLGTSVMVHSEFSDQFQGWIEVAGAHDFPSVYVSGYALIDSICTDMIANNINATIYQGFLDELDEVSINQVTLSNFGVINGLAFEVESQLLSDDLVGSLDGEAAFDIVKYQYFVNNYLTTLMTGSQTNNALFANDLFETNLTSQIALIDKPTLLMWGAYDMVVAPELGRSAFNELTIDEKELIIFNRSGHSPMINETDLFTTELINFIETYK